MVQFLLELYKSENPTSTSDILRAIIVDRMAQVIVPPKITLACIMWSPMLICQGVCDIQIKQNPDNNAEMVEIRFNFSIPESGFSLLHLPLKR